MSIVINDNFKVSAPKPSDSRYLSDSLQPWASVAAANTGIPAGERHLGLTVLVAEVSGELNEYWWKTNTTTLELKTTVGGVVGGGDPDGGGAGAGTSEIFVAIRTDGKAGSGTALDPYNWSDSGVSRGHLQSWSSLQLQITLRMAKGTYIIYPCISAGITNWQIWSGLTIIGAGIGRTTIIPAVTGSGRYVMFGTTFTGASGIASATERIVRGRFSDFTIDGQMDPTLPYADRYWAAFVMDGDMIEIRRIRITKLGGSSQRLALVAVHHTPSTDEASRECGIFIDEVEIVDIPHNPVIGCDGIRLSGGLTTAAGAPPQVWNKFALVTRCRLVNAGSLVVGQMRNAYVNDCYVDAKAKASCVSVEVGPVYNIRFSNCTFIKGGNGASTATIGTVVVGGTATFYDVGLVNCYLHSAVNAVGQAPVKMTGNAHVYLANCTIEPATNGDSQNGTTPLTWKGVISEGANNLFHCSGNRTYDGRTIPAVLCDSPPRPQNLQAWDNDGFMLNVLLVCAVTQSAVYNTSDYLLFQEVVFNGPGHVQTITVGLPNTTFAVSGMRRVISMPTDSSITTLQVRLTGVATVVDDATMDPGSRREYVFLNGAWKRLTATGVVSEAVIMASTVPVDEYGLIKVDLIAGGIPDGMNLVLNGTTAGKRAWLGLDDPYDNMVWNPTQSRWEMTYNDTYVVFFNSSNTPYPPSTGWVFGAGTANSSINSLTPNGHVASFVGQQYIAVLDDLRRYAWLAARVNPTEWLPNTTGVTWNPTLRKWRKAELSGADGGEIITWKDL